MCDSTVLWNCTFNPASQRRTIRTNSEGKPAARKDKEDNIVERNSEGVESKLDSGAQSAGSDNLVSEAYSGMSSSLRQQQTDITSTKGDTSGALAQFGQLTLVDCMQSNQQARVQVLPPGVEIPGLPRIGVQMGTGGVELQ